MDKRSEDTTETNDLPTLSAAQTNTWLQRLANSVEFVPQHARQDQQAPEMDSQAHQPVPQGLHVQGHSMVAEHPPSAQGQQLPAQNQHHTQGQQMPIHHQPGHFVHNEQIPVRILPGQYGPPQAQPLAVQYPLFQQMPPQYQPVQPPLAGYFPGPYMLTPQGHFVPMNPQSFRLPVQVTPITRDAPMRDMETQTEDVPLEMASAEQNPSGNTPSSVIPTKVSSANVKPADLIPAEMTPASVVPADLTPARTTLDDKTAAKDTDVMDTTTGDTSTRGTRSQDAPAADSAIGHNQADDALTKDAEPRDTPAKGIPVAMSSADQQKAPETQHKIMESLPNTTDAFFEDLALDALFIGDEPVDLPVFGKVSRTDYEKDRQKYHQSLLQHQQAMLDSIKNRGEPTKPAEEEEFQLVSKHKSFDQTDLTDKQKEAVRSAEMQSRKERIADLKAEKKLEAVVEKAIFDKEPCSSSSIPPSSSQVGRKSTEKAAQGKKSTPGKKKTEGKGEVAGDKRNSVFNKSIEYAMSVLLDAYFIRRADLRERKFSKYEQVEFGYIGFENQLLSNAVEHSGKLDADDVRAKNDYLDEVIALYPQSEQPVEKLNERSNMFNRFLKLLRSRDDEILLMDMAVIKSAKLPLWGYYFNCSIQNLETVKPSDIVESSDKSGDTTKKTAQSASSSSKRKEKKTGEKKEDDAFEDVAKFNMIRKVDVYCERRLKMIKSLYYYPCPPSDSAEDRLECSLQVSANRHPGFFTSTDVDLFQLICGMVLKKLPTWNISEDERAKVKEFYTMISGRQDDVLLMEAHVLIDFIRFDNGVASIVCCAYVNLFAGDRLQLPAKSQLKKK